MNPTYDSQTELSILKGAIENTNEAFITIDHSSTIVFFNKAAERMFGYGRDEIIGKDLTCILTPECWKGHQSAVARYVQLRKPKLIGHETEFYAVRKNGETFPTSISFSVAEIKGKLFFTGIIRDMTETKSLQEQIIKTERLAALGQTVAEISHEIKNPLMLIGGFAGQLLKTTQNERSQSKLKIITEEVRRLENLLSELKDLYTPRNMVFEKMDIHELLQEVYSLIKQDCDYKNIKMLFNIEGNNIWVEGDREKLKQVLINVVKNSVEALSEGETISIESLPSEKTVAIIITDSGPGIPEKIQEKIFSPFFTTKEHGTGLGLSISKRIIDDHPGSSLLIGGREDKGTIVKITLPYYRNEQLNS